MCLRFLVLIISLTLLSCAEGTKNKTPEEVYQQTLAQLQEAETFSYEVERIFASNDQRKMDMVFKIQKAVHEPHLGFFFYKEMDAQTKIYYKLASLAVVEDHKEKITVFDYGNDRSIPRYLKAYNEDEDNILQLRSLMEKNEQAEFLKEELLDDKNTYLYKLGPDLLWVNIETELPVKLAKDSKMDASEEIIYNGTIRNYRNILLNEKMDDSDFTAEENENYVTTHFGVKAEPLVGSKAAAWSLENLKGDKVSFSDFKGEYLFIEAWLSSCHHCIASVPKIKEIESQFGDKLKLVTINFDYDSEETQSAIDTHHIEYPVLLGNAQFDKDYDIRSFPSYYIIDKSGTIIYTNRGSITGEKEKQLFDVLKGLK